MPEQKTRKCPECAEEILIDARKCKHCGSDVTKGGQIANAGVHLIKAGIGLALFALSLYYFTR